VSELPDPSSGRDPSRWAPWQRAAFTLAIGLALAISWEMAGHTQIQVFYNQIFVARDAGNPDTCIPSNNDGNQGVVDNGGRSNKPADNTGPLIFKNFDAPGGHVSGDCLDLCVQLGYNNEVGSDVPIDSLTMEVFKFAPGSNPLDPSSTPPLRTFTFAAVGSMVGTNTTTNDVNNFPLGIMPLPTPGVLPGGANKSKGFCVGWDGAYNVEGEFGRTDGQFGFRVKAETHRQNPSQGNISIITDPPGIYPGIDTVPQGALQNPITIDVVDIHVVRSTPTVLGTRPAVAVSPYNIKYRISKDANVTMLVTCPTGGPSCGNITAGNPVRTVVGIDGSSVGLPRVGEGIPNGTLTNGDAWDGRDGNGNLMPAGNYTVTLDATATGAAGTDHAATVTRQLSMDPLQITDLTISPLLDPSTALAFLTYTLSEDATTYVDVYPPGTVFTCGLGNSFNSTPPDNTCPIFINGLTTVTPGVTDVLPSGCQRPRTVTSSAGCGGGTTDLVTPVRTIQTHQIARTPQLTIWDGRDNNGKYIEDGNYNFMLYAVAPSAAGKAITPGNGWSQPSVFTTRFLQGNWSINRGFVGVSQVTPRTSVMGSSPSVAGLDPFTFSYSITRDALVSVLVYHSTDTPSACPNNSPPGTPNCPVKTLVSQETRQPGFLNVERWIDSYSDQGKIVAPGDYLVQMTATDPVFQNKVSTVASTFPIDPLRLTDVLDTALLAGATDRVFLNYQLSRPMQITWTVYPPGSQVTWNPTDQFPPCEGLAPGTTIPPASCTHVTGQAGGNAVPVFQLTNFRPARPLKVTESWDGRDVNGVLLKDGLYPFTLVSVTTEPVEGSPFVTDRVVGFVTIARGPSTFQAFGVIPTIAPVVNSSEVVTVPPFEVDFSLTRTSSATVTVLDNNIPPRLVRTVQAGEVVFPNVLQKEFWDGRDDSGAFVPKGFYTIQVVGLDVQAQLLQPATFQQTVSVDPLQIYDVAVAPVTLDSPNAQIAYQVSEAMKVAIKIYKPGTSFDINGNAVPAETVSLVRALVGVKPARTAVKDLWDGKDFQLTYVTDGNYLFKIFGSTDITAIDSITGNVRPGTNLADGGQVSEIPVTRNGSKNPKNDFNNNTIIYPNPLPEGVPGNIKVRVPLAATVDVKIYTIAGDLVYDKFYTEQQPDSYVTFAWPRTNAAGRNVAPGVYLFVIREESTRGDKNVFQLVKKVMVQ
jgi:flagellar hook assembly protein FlgD